MSYSSEVLADSPLAYWKLDETTTVPPTAADSGSNATAWSFGPGAVGAQPAVVPDGGTSVRGSGTNPVCTLSSVPAGLSGSNVTLEAWVNLPGTNVMGSFVKIGSPSGGWGMGIGGTQWDNAGQKLILLSETVAWHPTTYTFPGAGTYHVMAVRGAAGAVTAYVNGVSVWSGTLSSPLAASGQMGVGGYTGSPLSSSVRIDNVAIFGAALTSTQVSAHYNGGNGDNAALAGDSPSVWLKLDEARTNSGAYDSTGNGRLMSYSPTPPLVGQASLLVDGSGNSITLNNSAHYLTIPSASWMATPSGVTVEARIKPAAAVLSGGGFVASRWGGGSNQWLLGVTSAGKLTGSVFCGGTTYTVNGASTLSADTVYTVALRWTPSGNVELFLNGVLDGAVSTSGAIGNPTVPIEIGRAALTGGAGLTWNGGIDEVSVTAAAVSNARLSARHAAAIAAASGIAGTVAATAPAPAVAVAGVVTRTGSVAAVASAPALAVSGAFTAPITGDVAATAAAPTAVVSGEVAGVTAGVVTATAPAPALSVTGDVTAPITGDVTAVASSPSVSVSDSTDASNVSVGVDVEVGALTLLNLVALPGVEVEVGGTLEVGDSQSVVPLPGVTIPVGASVNARPVELLAVDPRHKRAQWRYVITDLNNTPLGELTDLQHDPVEDAIGEAATMQFTMPASGDQYALVKPIETQCQVWDGNVLRLRGPILPGQPSDDGQTITYKVHDPSWFWRDGRRVITRIPQRNLLKNGDFRQGLTYWSRGYDKDSLPKAAPTVQVVTDDFAMDSDGLDPIRAAEIEGVESFTQSELSSNAVFYPNLATFRPGGKAAVEAVANAMPTTDGLKVSVVGHTANDGTGNGLGLSLRRAEAAKAVILSKRPHAIVSTKGVGYYDPKPGYPVDSQEQRRVVIGYNQTISGKSLQWMKQTLEVTHPKSAKYGLELTAAWMLKVADAWSVEDANMMSGRLVARRKSTPTKIYDESNASISDTDPVDRWIPQTTSVTIPADGRTYTVDLYLYAPAAVSRYAAVGLFPEEKLFFWGADQATIFRGVMEHIQKPEYGYADLGVGVRASATGVLRDREFAFRELIPADTALDGLTAISRGIEWDTLTTATATTAAAFYPRQGKTVDYVLALGGNVAAASPANTRDVGSQVIAQAQDLGSYRAMAYASDRKAFGGTLIQRVVTAEQDTPLNELGAAAKAELFWSRSSTPAYWVDIDPDSISDVLANTAKGDTVRLILDGAFNVDAQARIVRRQIHPDSLRLMLAFEEA